MKAIFLLVLVAAALISAQTGSIVGVSWNWRGVKEQTFGSLVSCDPKYPNSTVLRSDSLIWMGIASEFDGLSVLDSDNNVIYWSTGFIPIIFRVDIKTGMSLAPIVSPLERLNELKYDSSRKRLLITGVFKNVRYMLGYPIDNDSDTIPWSIVNDQITPDSTNQFFRGGSVDPNGQMYYWIVQTYYNTTFSAMSFNSVSIKQPKLGVTAMPLQCSYSQGLPKAQFYDSSRNVVILISFNPFTFQHYFQLVSPNGNCPMSVLMPEITSEVYSMAYDYVNQKIYGITPTPGLYTIDAMTGKVLEMIPVKNDLFRFMLNSEFAYNL